MGKKGQKGFTTGYQRWIRVVMIIKIILFALFEVFLQISFCRNLFTLGVKFSLNKKICSCKWIDIFHVRLQRVCMEYYILMRVLKDTALRKALAFIIFFGQEKKTCFAYIKKIYIHIYGRTCHDGYLTKKMGIFPLLYVHIGEYSTTFEVYWFHLNRVIEASQNMQKYDQQIFAFTQQPNSNFLEFWVNNF